MGIQFSDWEDAVIKNGTMKYPGWVCPLGRIEELLAEIMPLLPARKRKGILSRGRAMGVIDTSPYKANRLVTPEEIMLRAPEARARFGMKEKAQTDRPRLLSRPATYVPSQSALNSPFALDSA